MDNLINETNTRLQDIIDDFNTIKDEYESKLEANSKEINHELSKVRKYKEEFFNSKQKIEKMQDDINGFEEDYKNLVDRFKDDELANILIAANKEISAKIDERKRKIAKDKIAMNELVEKAENSKNRLVKLTAEKKALELCLSKILDAHEFYTKSLLQIINYSEDNRGNLSACFYEQSEDFEEETVQEEIDENVTDTSDEDILFEEKYIAEDDDEEFEETDEVEEQRNVIGDIVEENEIEVEDASSDKEAYEDEEEIDLSMDDIDDEEISEVESVSIDEIENDEESDMPEEVSEIEIDEIGEPEEIDDYDNEDVIEGDEHLIYINKDNDYDINDDLDLENMIDFDDSLEDDYSLYEDKENEEK